MPELPEVETVVGDLNKADVVGKKILDVTVNWPKSISSHSPKEFKDYLIGKSFDKITRRGKFIHLHLDDNSSLLIHLRMSGHILIKELDEQINKHEQVLFHVSDKLISFHDPRKFGRITLTNNPASILDKLGEEPFSEKLTALYLYEKLQSKKKNMKTLLLDQSFIAGIGNIYADEILFDARISPLRISNTVTKKESEALLKSMRKILEIAIEKRGTSLGTGESNFRSGGKLGNHGQQLAVFRQTGKKCINCFSPIEKIKVAQRSTHYCPKCQK